MLLLRVTGQAFEFRIGNPITEPVDLLPSKRGTKRVRWSWRICLLDEVIPCRFEQIAYSIYLWQLRSEPRNLQPKLLAHSPMTLVILPSLDDDEYDRDEYPELKRIRRRIKSCQKAKLIPFSDGYMSPSNASASTVRLIEGGARICHMLAYIKPFLLAGTRSVNETKRTTRHGTRERRLPACLTDASEF